MLGKFSRWQIITVVGLLVVFIWAGMVFAQEDNLDGLTLRGITIEDKKEFFPGTLTVPSNAEATRIIQLTPGGVDVVLAETFEDTYSLNLEDTVGQIPGIFAKKRFGEEVRISIRGSGLSRSYHALGLRLIQDGIPFNAADGSADFQDVDTQVLQRIEVYKGGNGMQYGGTTLGGVVNMITKTGHSHPGHQYRFEMGSDDTYRMNLQSGFVFDKSDAFFSLTGADSDGFREHADQQNIKFNTNYGLKLSDTAETRFYFASNHIELELPGTVTLGAALGNPEAAASASLTADQQRDIRQVRLANKTTFDLGDGDQVDIGAFVNYKDLFHPITSFVGVIDQNSWNFGLFGEGTGTYSLGGFDNFFRMGITTQTGVTDAKVFANSGGVRGALTSNSDQTANNVVVYGQNHLYVTPELAFVTGLQYVYAYRRQFDILAKAESDSGREYYESFKPKIGILYEPSETVQFFANASKSYEPPDFSNLTSSGTTGFTPVEAQGAWTAEIGTRGEKGRYAWDLSLYRAWIKDEILQFTTGTGVPNTTFNAEDTIHQGAEIGLDVQLGQNLISGGDSLQWRNAYTYSDFFFVSDDQYGDNDIPGQPPHLYQTELRYDHSDSWFTTLKMDVASSVDADFTNTFTAPGYAIVGLGAGYDVNKKVSLFFDARNLLDKRYISNLSTSITATSASTDFYAGDDRRFFGGVRWKF